MKTKINLYKLLSTFFHLSQEANKINGINKRIVNAAISYIWMNLGELIKQDEELKAKYPLIAEGRNDLAHATNHQHITNLSDQDIRNLANYFPASAQQILDTLLEEITKQGTENKAEEVEARMFTSEISYSIHEIKSKQFPETNYEIDEQNHLLNSVAAINIILQLDGYLENPILLSSLAANLMIIVQNMINAQIRAPQDIIDLRNDLAHLEDIEDIKNIFESYNRILRSFINEQLSKYKIKTIEKLEAQTEVSDSSSSTSSSKSRTSSPENKRNKSPENKRKVKKNKSIKESETLRLMDEKQIATLQKILGCDFLPYAQNRHISNPAQVVNILKNLNDHDKVLVLMIYMMLINKDSVTTINLNTQNITSLPNKNKRKIEHLVLALLKSNLFKPKSFEINFDIRKLDEVLIIISNKTHVLSYTDTGSTHTNIASILFEVDPQIANIIITQNPNLFNQTISNITHKESETTLFNYTCEYISKPNLQNLFERAIDQSFVKINLNQIFMPFDPIQQINANLRQLILNYSPSYSLDKQTRYIREYGRSGADFSTGITYNTFFSLVINKNLPQLLWYYALKQNKNSVINFSNIYDLLEHYFTNYDELLAKFKITDVAEDLINLLDKIKANYHTIIQDIKTLSFIYIAYKDIFLEPNKYPLHHMIINGNIKDIKIPEGKCPFKYLRNTECFIHIKNNQNIIVRTSLLLFADFVGQKNEFSNFVNDSMNKWLVSSHNEKYGMHKELLLASMARERGDEQEVKSHLANLQKLITLQKSHAEAMGVSYQDYFSDRKITIGELAKDLKMEAEFTQAAKAALMERLKINYSKEISR